MILNVNKLSFSYKSVDALKSISFSVNAGEVTVIIGPNGVGKTTLLKCLNHILFPHKGEIRIKNKNIRSMTIKEIARDISYVPQKNDAVRLTVFDTILMGRLPHIRYTHSKEDLEKVDAVMKQLNLEHLGLKYLDCLSGGELQKVAIARALVQQTDLILMDEPTSALDLKNQAHILSLIRHIVKDHHMAAVLTMHDLNAALRYADQFICLKNNTIFSAGTIADIRPEMIEQVYGINVDIIHHKGCPLVIPAEIDTAA